MVFSGLWGQCGHGLSSRPRESCDAQVVKPLLDFFGHAEAAAPPLQKVSFLFGARSFQ